MITKEELFEAGKFHKTHGVKGELSCSFHKTVDTENLRYIVSIVDGIFVPFFIETLRVKTPTSALIKLVNIDSENDAKELLSSPIYLPLASQQIDTDEVDVSYFVGYSVVDTIIAVDETTVNTLFCVENKQKEMLYIPVAEEFIVSIDEQSRIIHMNLPSGLLTINE